MTSKENMRKNNRTYYQRHKEEILKRRKAKREDYKNQLAQAKELLKNLLHALKNEGSDYTFALESTHPILAQAEQFLKEIEK
jgi:hypothetical protein